MAIPAAAYVVAIAVADPAPVVSRVIYAVAPTGYFVIIWRLRSTAPPGAVERDFT